MKSRSLLSLLLLLLIAAALPSCKSPMAPSPAGPTLTLILPDSAHVYDTIPFIPHFSEPIEPTWVFAWQFGDSAKASTRLAPVSHIYDSVGTYTVHAAVMDTVALQTIAKQTAQIKIMPLNTPTLTLNIPPTNFWGDSCVMSIQSSIPLKPSWTYSWSFGDSTILTSPQDTILHYFVTPGTFTVRVSLSDTLHHIPLGSRMATVQVTARHFNLALLQSMPYVDFSWQSRTDTSHTSEWGPGCGGSPPVAKALIWSGTNFIMGSNYSYDYPDSISPDYSNPEFGGGNDTLSGLMDISSSQIVKFSENIYYNATNETIENGQIAGGCGSYTSTNYTAVAIPFIFESDTDIVFEANGDMVKSASSSSHNDVKRSHIPDQTYDITADFSDSTVKRFVRFRFHK